jgi:hypothetical protein
MVYARLLLKISVLLWGSGFLASLIFRHNRGPALFGLAAATAAGFGYIAWRYWLAWPMTPMYLGTAGVPPVLGILALNSIGWRLRQGDGGLPAARALQAVLLVGLAVGILSICFPKDFYLPFLKTISGFSHFMLWFMLLGKAAFFLSGVWAVTGLSNGSPPRLGALSFNWLVWGFAFWTLSMFSGEIWSYQGWGVPVVWEDASITTTMATWFYYIALLHLHLTGTWSQKARSLAAGLGILVIIVLNCGPDLGPLRSPFKP